LIRLFTQTLLFGFPTLNYPELSPPTSIHKVFRQHLKMSDMENFSDSNLRLGFEDGLGQVTSGPANFTAGELARVKALYDKQRAAAYDTFDPVSIPYGITLPLQTHTNRWIYYSEL
jgi:hypothetical protein